MDGLRRSLVLLIPLAALLLAPPPTVTAEGAALLDVLEQELERSLTGLADAGSAPLYYLQYSVREIDHYVLAVSEGGLEAPEATRERFLDVDLRVGSMELDNTHEIRGSNWHDPYGRVRYVDFPVEDDPAAMRATLWNETEYQFQKAQERLTQVKANRQVKVEEEDLSADFSPGQAHTFIEQPARTRIDEDRWTDLLKRIGTYFAQHDFVIHSRASLSADDETNYLVNSDRSRLQHTNHYLRVNLRVSGMAEDGMDLLRTMSYSASDPSRLPDEATLMADAEQLVDELRALRVAPVVEPYIGPAILRNRASGVFFHEIFGHRIEGHRQKSESEGQTFTKKVNEQILPPFISVYDDPTLARFQETDLRGYYRYDDEGTPAQRVVVVEDGVLRSFLTSRSPIDGFPQSNGHGRRSHGYEIVSRQGNLIIASDRTVEYARLRELLIEECRRQEKPYGLVFEDISGGFTMTGRRGPQAFKVLPLLVRRVYADGRPDEVVRGVDIVGTPLTSFSKIIMTGNDDAVFNGTCGAESGWCPVSAISPSILVSEIEVEKRQKGQDKPPILSPPQHGGAM